MINYFFLYILSGLLAFVGITTIEKPRLRIVYVLVGFLLFLFAAFRSENIDRDYENYTMLYENANELNILLIEPSFVFISHIVRFLYNNVAGLFIMYAFLGVLIKFLALKQLSELYILSILIYVSTFFLLHEMTQIRAGVAAGFLLMCVKPIYDKKLGAFLLYALLAFTFHYSSIIILPLFFISSENLKVKTYVGIIVCVYAFHFANIHFATVLERLPFENLQFKVEANKEAMVFNDDRIKVFNLLQVIRLLLCLFLMWKIDLIKAKNKYAIILLKIYVYSLCAMVILADIPTFAVRVSELLGVVEIVLLPLLAYIVKPQKIGAFLVVLLAFFFLSVNLFYTKLLIFAK